MFWMGVYTTSSPEARSSKGTALWLRTTSFREGASRTGTTACGPVEAQTCPDRL